MGGTSSECSNDIYMDEIQNKQKARRPTLYESTHPVDIDLSAYLESAIDPTTQCTHLYIVHIRHIQTLQNRSWCTPPILMQLQVRRTSLSIAAIPDSPSP